MKAPILTTEALTEALETLNQSLETPWQIVEGKLNKQFIFVNFRQAFAFMTQVAMVAEKMNHHPEWSNVYRTVNIELVTHHSGGITELDITLAGKIEQLLSLASDAS